MANIKIQPFDNGPYEVKGEADILDGTGKLLETKTDAHLCRCGLTTNPPYCSGAHKGKFDNEIRAK